MKQKCLFLKKRTYDPKMQIFGPQVILAGTQNVYLGWTQAPHQLEMCAMRVC